MKRHALFVGVNDYVDAAFKNLRYSLSDAVALSGAFAVRGFDVEVLSNPKAEAVLGAVERKSTGLGPGDVFLFFFAGHGFTAPDGSHLLICADDKLAYLRHNRAGIPVELLEDVTNGRGCNRAFLLDACRTDVFAGMEKRGAETRDLAPVSLPDAKVHAGTCCVLRSCDRFCPAMEFDDLGHGVFTRAVMDMMCDESVRAMPFGEAFVGGIRSHMRSILSAHGAVADQNPCFQSNGEAFCLFDVDCDTPRPFAPPPSTHQSTAAPALVVCPVCSGNVRIEGTHNCVKCGKKYVCADCWDREYRCCSECAGKVRKEAEEREAAGRRAREEQERESAERRTQEEEERKSAREISLRNGTCLETGICRAITLPGGAKIEMVYCPPGEFVMGSPKSEEGRCDDEMQHRVRLTKGFWIGKYPVTQRQWRSVMESNPSHFEGDDLPVETVSWDDCQAFIEKVNVALGCGARLPTEAEWEYACRAGTTTAYSWGNALNGDRANCNGNYPCGTAKKGPYLEKTTQVGKYGANPWGLCDMHGNVWDWCADWYGDYSGDAVDPTGPASGVNRVLRGGCWSYYARNCRSAYRSSHGPGRRYDGLGFRLSCSAGPRG